MPSSAIKVWKHREINEPQRFVAAGERFTLVVGGSSEVGSRHHRTAARADIDRLGPQRRQEVGQSGLPHPVAQVQGAAAPNQQGVGLLDSRDPIVGFTLGRAGELEHSHDFPPNPHIGPGVSADDR